MANQACAEARVVERAAARTVNADSNQSRIIFIAPGGQKMFLRFAS
jgi:hypothetical protein